MKTQPFCLVLVFAMAVPLHAQQTNDGVSAIDIANPPAHLKRSALIEFLNRRSLTQFPSTVDALVRQLIYADAAPARVFIPRGRSAQSSATDEFEPRIVIAPHSANKITDRIALGFENYTAYPGNDYEGRLFFGFANRTKKGESLSWNRQTRQFDYFVITDWGNGKRPRVLEVTQREDCNKCHQGGAPIWVVPPWSEIVTHDPRVPFRNAAPIKFNSPPVILEKDGVLITREQTPRENNVGLAIDTAVSLGNRLVQSNRVMTELCGKDLTCRRLLLVAALSRSTPILTVTDGFQSSYQRKVVVKVSSTGNDGVDLDFVVGPLQPLRNLLNPGLNNVSQIPAFLNGLEAFIQNHWARDGYAFTAQTLPDPTAVGSGALTQRDIDPLTPRQPLGPIPKNLAVPFLYDVAFETLGFTYQDSLRFQSISLKERMDALDAGYFGGIKGKLHTLLSHWPPSREDVLAFYGLGDADAPSPRTPTPAAADSGSAMASFEKHCQSCHSNPNGDTPFIPFPSAADLRQFNIDNQQTVEDRLVQRTMPPVRVTARPTETEYQAMIQFLTGQNTAAPASGARRPTRTNYLGMRYQDVQGIRASYLAADGTSIVEEGYLDPSRLRSFQKGRPPDDLRGALKVGKGNDGKLYFALENFPHYFLGNITQISSYRSGQFPSHTILAVSRNGALNVLGYDFAMRSYATVPLTLGKGPAVTLVHVSGLSDNQAYATGSDGNIYRLAYSGLPATTYDLIPINVQGYANVKWQKVGFSKYRDRIVSIAQSVDGRRLMFDAQLGGTENWLPIQEMAIATLREQDFEPNLLDRNSVVLNPWGDL